MSERTIHALAALCLGVCALMCGCGQEAVEQGGRPVIAVSIYPLADVTQQLVGEAAEVVCLLPPGQSPHAYEMTASQLAKLRRATLVINVGLGVDPWVAAAVKQQPRMEMAHVLGIETPVGLSDHHHHGHDHANCTAEHGGVNPHIWLDPVHMRKFVDPLAKVLSAAFAEHADRIAANRERYAAELDALDADYRAQLTAVKRKDLVTFHDAFSPLAERYGLHVAATLTTSQAPAAGMTVNSLKQAVEAIARHEVKTVFTEPQFSARAAEQLTQRAGVAVMMLDPLGDPYSDDRAGYLPMMRYNLRQLVAGLHRE